MNARIAIPFADGNVFRHFGKSTQFKIYTIADDKVTASETVGTDGTGHEALGLWLLRNGVNAVICGDIGPGALGALAAAGIAALAGVEGPADDAIAKLLAGTLEASPAANCGHHAGGGCGSHGCGGCHGSGGCGCRH